MNVEKFDVITPAHNYDERVHVASKFFRDGEKSMTPNWKRLEEADEEVKKAILTMAFEYIRNSFSYEEGTGTHLMDNEKMIVVSWAHQFVAELYLPENEHSISMGR